MKTLADLIQDRFGLPTEAGRGMPAEGTVARILSHRIHRRYTADPVSDETLEIVLAAGLSAPSKSDLQQVAIVVVKDPSKQATIAGWIPAMPWIGQCPRFLVFCGDHRRIRRVAELRGKPFPNDTLDMFMNAAVDAVSELLVLPAGVFPVAGLCLGYPALAGWISMRLPPALTVHTDRYDDSRLEALVEDYDRRREARHATPRQGQRFADRFGYAERYGWSEDKARQYSVPERHNFGPFIRRHGFGLA
ncbi:MAG: NADPH-dependent oxidoreductase [Candidatus Rokuibacteriota bacterium]|nr:MAG: NADPH-dependent oxidoreductase [Candidatus Rokubacteria bacterium]